MKVKKKININDIFENYKSYLKSCNCKNNIVLKEKNLEKDITTDYEKLVNEFLSIQEDEMNEEGSMAIELAEEENDYHIVSYWLQGNYDVSEEFLNKHYSEGLCNYILKSYPYDLNILKQKIVWKFGPDGINKYRVVLETLATILLKHFQENCITWCSVYGCEEKDMIDFTKANITNALGSKEYPIIKTSDISAAMLGVSFDVTPSDMYDVFAHLKEHLDNDISLIDRNNSIDESQTANERCKIFTPDPFQVLAISSRWKLYDEFIKKNSFKNTELTLQYQEIIQHFNVEEAMLSSILEEYTFRFSKAPKGAPLHPEMVTGRLKDNKLYFKLKVRGIQNATNTWDVITEKAFDIPKTSCDYQKLIYELAYEFKKELLGMEKEKGSVSLAHEGKYPTKYSASHGLNYIENLNVKFTNDRGISEKKIAKSKFTLEMAEKQALYFIKKSIRLGNNPYLSSSFGKDSVLVNHLIERVTKKYSIVHNDSLVEYNELISFRNYLINEWHLSDKIHITKPQKGETYWDVVSKYGFNFNRKGDRRANKFTGKKVSVSEICCNNLKHLPMKRFIDNLIKNGKPMTVDFSGLRADESRNRTLATKRDGIVYYAKNWNTIRVNPIAFFTDTLVQQYYQKYAVPYCSIYENNLYYQDVFDEINEDSKYWNKVYYTPRIGCWTCLLRGKAYLQWLKFFKYKQYIFLLKNKGLAEALFERGLTKMGIIQSPNENNSKQLSFFDNEKSNSFDDLKKSYSIEDMIALIEKRPCKFLE